MAVGAVDPVLMDAMIFLGGAVVVVPLFKRLGLGSVLGYLAAGALIGPFGFGFFEEVEEVLHFAEFGVVLLLFVIGLELNPSRLWRMRSQILGLGLTQVLLAGLAIGLALSFLAGFSWQAAVAGGGALALSSTAFAVQILRDKGELTSRYGDKAFAILLLQDIAIVPLLALTVFLSPWGDKGAGWESAGLALLALAVVVGVGRWGLRPLFRLIALTRADEVFTAAALLVVVSAALLMQFAGLSMAMGAFLAGVLLAESEFRHQLETDIEPFRGLLLGLFFIGVGMSVAWPVVLENWWIVLGGALALYLVKAGLIIGITRVAGSDMRDALRIAAVLGQGGEFGFVLLTVGRTSGLWPRETETMIAAIITISMALTPLAVTLADRWIARGAPEHDMDGIDDVEEADEAPVIVAGFGRFGQVVARILRLRGYEVTTIDNDPRRIQIARSFGNKVFFGDLRRGDILRTAGAEKAKAIFLCGDEPGANERAIEMLRERLPHTLIFARASDRFDELKLEALGADGVVRETLESSVTLARLALERLGDADRAEDIIEEFRRRDVELLRLQSEYGARGGYEKMRAQFSLEEER